MKRGNTMKHRKSSAFLLGLGMLFLGGCSAGTATGADAPPTADGSTSPSVVGTVEDPLGTVAFATDDPEVFFAWRSSGDITAIAEGTVTEVKYSTVTTTEGVDEPFSMRWPTTVVTLDVNSSDADLPGTILVKIGGAYLPVTDKDVKAGVDAPVTKDGEVVAFQMPGGGDPAKVGDHVVVFLRPTTGSARKVADYVVAGSSYGYFVADDSRREFVQAASNQVALSAERLNEVLAD